MTRILLDHVQQGLEQLGSERIQRELWTASEGPMIGSFDEAVEQTFTDSGLSDALEKQRGLDALPIGAIAPLEELDRALRSVDRTLEVNDLIGSQAMARVRATAAAALEALGRSAL